MGIAEEKGINIVMIKEDEDDGKLELSLSCLLYTSPSPRDRG